MHAAANNVDGQNNALAYIASLYHQTTQHVKKGKEVVVDFCESVDKSISDYVQARVSKSTHDVFMKFIRSWPELGIVTLLLIPKTTFAGAIFWGVRTVISLMPLLAKLLSLDLAEISKGAVASWESLMKQHKNFVPAMTVLLTIATLNTFRLFSLTALAQCAVLLAATLALWSSLIEAPAAPAQQQPQAPLGCTTCAAAKKATLLAMQVEAPQPAPSHANATVTVAVPSKLPESAPLLASAVLPVATPVVASSVAPSATGASKTPTIEVIDVR